MTNRVVLIGHPVAHSFSGAMQQAALDALGIDARYELWDRRQIDLADAIAQLRGEEFLGANITIPHKEHVVPLMDRLTEDAQATGAVNVISREGKKLIGHNTDVPGFKVALDKLPLNTMKLPLIARLFPEAKILFALRDPRDVVLSCFRQRFRMNPSMYEFLTLDGAARFYDGVMRLADLYRAKLSLDLHTHRYEDLVEDFDGQTRTICDFIGLPWRAEMRDFAATLDDRSTATPSSTQVARGLYREGVGQWRRYRDQLAPVLPVLAPWVATYGYPAD